MSDADDAGSHGRASKVPRSVGGRVARVRQQFEAADALPSPSARATVSAPQVTAAGSAPGSAGKKRKTTQQRPAAKARGLSGGAGRLRVRLCEESQAQNLLSGGVQMAG
ncbi:hypothetical protein WJX79_009979 [Trebouxia sp. C0005]